MRKNKLIKNKPIREVLVKMEVGENQSYYGNYKGDVGQYNSVKQTVAEIHRHTEKRFRLLTDNREGYFDVLRKC